MATEREKHRDHSRKVALRCAELLVREWPTLHLDGFDVDRAAVLIAVELPACMIQFELEIEQDLKDHPQEPVDPSRSIGARLRKALGVGDVTTLQAIEIAIVRLTTGGDVGKSETNIADFDGSMGCPWCRNGVEQENGKILVQRISSGNDIDWGSLNVIARSHCTECRRTFEEVYGMQLGVIREVKGG